MGKDYLLHSVLHNLMQRIQGNIEIKTWRGCRAQINPFRSFTADPCHLSGYEEIIKHETQVMGGMPGGIHHLSTQVINPGSISQVLGWTYVSRRYRDNLTVFLCDMTQDFERSLPECLRVKHVFYPGRVADHLSVRIVAQQLSGSPRMINVDVGQEDVIEVFHSKVLKGIEENGERRKGPRIHNKRLMRVGVDPGIDKGAKSLEVVLIQIYLM
jgi:hypothetical protein